MKLSIISLNYKKPDITTASMASVYKHYQRSFDQKEWEYIVVDNHSEDNSVKILKKEVASFPSFFFIENSENIGFGAGNNVGAQQARGDYLLFLNNDTIITGNGIQEMLIYLQQHPEIAILGGELHNTDGSSQPSGGKFYIGVSLLLFLLGMQKVGGIDTNPTAIAKVDWVKGALFMIKRTVFEKIGGFDKNMFMYMEDMELCYRAKKMGYQSYFFPTNSIVHKDQGSSSRTFAIVHIYKSLLYFYKKHRPMWEYLLVKLLLQTKAILLILYGKLLKKEYFVVTYEEALSIC